MGKYPETTTLTWLRRNCCVNSIHCEPRAHSAGIPSLVDCICTLDKDQNLSNLSISLTRTHLGQLHHLMNWDEFLEFRHSVEDEEVIAWVRRNFSLSRIKNKGRLRRPNSSGRGDARLGGILNPATAVAWLAGILQIWRNTARPNKHCREFRRKTHYQCYTRCRIQIGATSVTNFQGS